MADADATLVDGHDAAWWKAQWEQLKAENDRINPQLDAQTAKRQLAEQSLAEANSRLAEGDRLLEVTAKSLDACRGELANALADAQAKGQRIAALETANARHVRNIAACAAAVGPLHEALSNSLNVE